MITTALLPNLKVKRPVFAALMWNFMTVEDIVITEVSTFENKWLYIFFTWLQYTILFFHFFLMSPHAHITSPTYILTDANAREHPKSMLSLFKLTMNFLVSTRTTMELLRLATCHSDWSKTSMSVRDTLTLGECVWQVMGHGLHQPGCFKQRADGTGESYLSIFSFTQQRR